MNNTIVDSDSFNRLEPILSSNGYEVVPIRGGKKYPVGNNWGSVDHAGTNHKGCGIGIKTRSTVGVDLDIRDQYIAEIMTDYVIKHVGQSPVRIGMAPKCLLPFRCEEPFSKISSKKYVDKNGVQHQVEILGNGQQFVAHNIHQDTGEPYSWHSGDLTAISRENLPLITLELAQGVIDEFEQTVEMLTDWTAEQDIKSRQEQKAVAPTNLVAHGEEAAEAQELLTYIAPDADYSDWVKVGMALHSKFNGSQNGLSLFDQWSQGGDKYKEGEPAKKWGTFDGTGGVGFGTITNMARSAGADLSAIARKHSGGAVGAADSVVSLDEFDVISVDEPGELSNPGGDDGLTSFDKINALAGNGKSNELRLTMLDDEYVLGNVALMGQWTTFYAAPNSGKTLITLKLISEFVSNDELTKRKVLYVNVDDTYKGGIEKLEIAEEHGFSMLLPNVSGFDANLVLPAINAMAKDGSAKGVVVILDTLKKFVDLMDKKISSEVGNVFRRFVSAGGTIIALAHVNKSKDVDGKSIKAGTSDIGDDCDCVYIIEAGGDEYSSTRTATFVNQKDRGDVAQKVVYEFTKSDGDSYQDIYNSVRVMPAADAQNMEANKKLNERLCIDQELIDEIRHLLKAQGEVIQSELIHVVSNNTGAGRNKIITILNRWDFKKCKSHFQWRSKRGDKNAKIFTL